MASCLNRLRRRFEASMSLSDANARASVRSMVMSKFRALYKKNAGADVPPQRATGSVPEGRVDCAALCPESIRRAFALQIHLGVGAKIAVVDLAVVSDGLDCLGDKIVRKAEVLAIAAADAEEFLDERIVALQLLFQIGLGDAGFLSLEK